MTVGPVALVTGGNRGIGLATARQLRKQGMRVAVTYRDEPPSGDFLAVRCDVRDAAEVDAAFTRVEQELGPVEVLVANAGVTRDKLLALMSETDFGDVLDINLMGAYRVAKRAVRPMMRARRGRIVVVSSVSGLLGAPGQTNYAAAKAGLVGFARSLALELASREVTVNVVAPGWIDTDMTRVLPEAQREQAKGQVPLRRSGTAEEVASLIGYLTGPEAGYITGAVIPVDGGLTLGQA